MNGWRDDGQRLLARLVGVGLLGVVSVSCAAGPEPARPQVPPTPAAPWRKPPEPDRLNASPATALVGATVLTAAGPALEDAVVLVEHGRIAAVGARADVPLPADSAVVNLRGHFITPGLIDAHSHMGVYAVPSAQAHQDGNEATRPVTADVRAIDSFWPQDPALSYALAAGVTSILVLPGSANLIGGRGTSMQLLPGRGARDMRLPGGPPSLKMACGENPKRVYKKSGPSTRMGNLARVRAVFQEAVEYGEDYRRYAARFEKWQTQPGQTQAPSPPERDRGLETLLGAIEGRILVQIHCYRADEMLAMIELADEFGFPIRAFHHAVEAYKIRDILAARGIGVATWVDWWGFKLEAYDAIEENIGLLSAAGVRVALHSDSPELVQRLNLEVAKGLGVARRSGVEASPLDALQWVTLNAAWILGVDDRLGSLERGKQADLVVWSGDPLSIHSKVERVFIAGAEAYSSEQGRRLSDFELGQSVESLRPTEPRIQ